MTKQYALEPDLADLFRVFAGFSVSYLGRGSVSLIIVWELFVATDDRLIHLFEYVLGFAGHLWLVERGLLAF